MKRIIAISVALILVLTLCACGKKDDSLSTDTTQTSSVTDTTVFTPPADYVSVVTVTINPTFNLYLDAKNVVLAVEPVNADAKSMQADIDLTDKSLDAVVEKIITAANTKGFITEETKDINISVTELKSESIKADDILSVSKKAADDTAKEININVTVVIIDNSAAEPTSSKADKTSSKPIQTNTSSAISGSHTHSYKAATCTAPKTCPCGATVGKALGHSFKDGKCTVCGAADPNAVTYTSVLTKAGFWTCRYIVNAEVGEQLYDATLIFKAPAGGDYEDSMIFVGGSRLAEPEDITYYPEEVFEYNGKKYVGAFGNGGNALGNVQENGSTIILTDPDGDGDTIKLQRVNETTLKVVACSGEYSDLRKIPVGTVLTFSTTL